MSLDSSAISKVQEQVITRRANGRYSVREVWDFLDRFADSYEPESEKLVIENPLLVEETIKWGLAFHRNQRRGLYKGKWNALMQYVNERGQKLKNNQSQEGITK